MQDSQYFCGQCVVCICARVCVFTKVQRSVYVAFQYRFFAHVLLNYCYASQLIFCSSFCSVRFEHKRPRLQRCVKFYAVALLKENQAHLSVGFCFGHYVHYRDKYTVKQHTHTKIWGVDFACTIKRTGVPLGSFVGVYINKRFHVISFCFYM